MDISKFKKWVFYVASSKAKYTTVGVGKIGVKGSVLLGTARSGMIYKERPLPKEECIAYNNLMKEKGLEIDERRKIWVHPEFGAYLGDYYGEKLLNSPEAAEEAMGGLALETLMISDGYDLVFSASGDSDVYAPIDMMQEADVIAKHGTVDDALTISNMQRIISEKDLKATAVYCSNYTDIWALGQKEIGETREPGSYEIDPNFRNRQF